MKKQDSLTTLQQRYDLLASKLGTLGLVLQGTITKRTIMREDSHSPGKEKAYGPYYQWTRKQSGKTVTVNLTASQARTYQKAIENNQKMEKIITEMRTVSLQICEATTKGVKKRKTRK
jgi:hypothetical protein